ncbi:IKI3 family protein [Nitzschia inconspicua]|uniref:IKI3 family protein n=1 Tax=Nitzschia inconspicua TaxID=303405 RepID=A0A9K3KV71_9STRA|nr:IKI3 family protein [Nitzschia inconspicua]
MENLFLLGERRRRLDLPNDNPHYSLVQNSTLTDRCDCILTAEDDDLDDSATTCTVVLLTENGVVIKVTDSGTVLWTCHLNDESDIDSGWFKIDCINSELVCLSQRGAIVTVDPSTGEAELVGVFDQGLEDAVWSPDGETLLMVTSITDEEDDTGHDENKNDNDNNIPTIHSRLMTMNTQFEVLAEVTIPRYVTPSTLGVDADISLTWRPDGALCAVSSVDAEDNARKVRIYKRESLDLHAIGRAEDASGALVKNVQKTRIAWAGTGCSQVLAAVQRKGKKTQQIIFFEPNGLRHREFLLRGNPSANVTSLAWNSNSDLLAVGLREAEGLETIQLWHRMNYHWYLKREFQYRDQRVEKFQFSTDNAYTFCVLLQGLEWREYQLGWDPSTTLTMDGVCNAFVIDGSSLNVTEFEKALIPPPMYAKCHSLESPINDLSFCYHDGQYWGSALICQSTGSLAFLRFDPNGANYDKPLNILWENLQGNDPTCFRSILITKSEQHTLHFVLITCASCNDANERLVEGIVEGLDTGEPKASIVNSLLLNGRAVRTTGWLDATGSCLVQMRDRALYEYEMSESGGLLVASEAEPLPEVCPWVSAIKDSSRFAKFHSGELERPRLIFGLSSKSRLYFHDMMLTDSASSFIVSMGHEFLCYVSKGSRCQARFLPLSEVQNYDPLMGMDQNHLLEGYEPRNVEQGANLVAVLPEKPEMILQMPRGNLEGIHPRALLLRYVIQKVINGSYEEAFRMMRKHKVDLNIIVDLDPKGFLENGILSFVKQVDNIDHLNLFISTLQNHDITGTRFPVPSWLRRDDSQVSGSASFDFSTKVNQVCSKAREVMMTMESTGEKPTRYYLLPVLSTFAKEDPPKLDEALRLIKCDALSQPVKSTTKNPLFAESAQHSIHYLAFLAEYQLLFETALGMYDYEVARAVARNSQMDPKVYLPLLKRYNALPEYFSRFEVDVRLKRYDWALRNLHQSYQAGERFENVSEDIVGGLTVKNTFQDCLSLIEEHQLHKVGLDLFRNDADKKKIILSSLGNSLMIEGKPKTALTIFLSAVPPDVEGAKQAARASKDWRFFFSLLDESTGDPIVKDEFWYQKRRQAARDIAVEITSSSSSFSTESFEEACFEAARILLDYGDDWIGAVDYFIQAKGWSEGYRIGVLNEREDLKKKVIDGAVSFAHASLDSFVDRSSEFEAANSRYAEVLKLRKHSVQTEGFEAVVDTNETDSLFSTASTASNMSLRSNASSYSTRSGLSSVISIKSTTTFQMTGGEENDRHRSKFNKGKKRKDCKNKKKTRQKPGSVEELQELVGVMKASCPNSHYSTTISDTIRFLILVGQTSLAEEVYFGFQQMVERIVKSKLERIKTNVEEKNEAAALTRTEGDQLDLSHLLIELPIEKEVDEITCIPLDAGLLGHFHFVIPLELKE